MIHSTRKVITAALLALIFLLPVSAHAEQQVIGRAPRLAQVRFELQVQGIPARGATYWVAYGPIGGKFGVLRLRRMGTRMYGATHAFPAGSRGEFVYLEGTGQVRTPAGPAPGGMVVTIRRTALSSLHTGLVCSVSWSAPVG